MFIKLAQSDFLNALQVVQRGTASQSTLPILTGIKIKTDGTESVILHATDLELSIETRCAAVVKKAGSVVVTGKLLVDIVRHLPEGAIEISSEGEQKSILVKAEKSSFKVKTMPPEDFPAFPEVEEKKTVGLDAKMFSEMIRQTSRSISRDETRPVLTGALLCAEAKSLIMVATDSYRLAVKTAVVKTKNVVELSVIIPHRALDEIQKAIVSQDGALSMSTDESLLKISTENTVIVTRLIEGQFPNYKQLIPKETSLSAEVNKEEMVGAISRVALLAQKNMSVKMTAEAQKVSVSAATQGIGEADETVKAKTKGEKTGEMAFNAQYLLDGFQATNGERVLLEFTGSVNPGLIKSLSEDDFLYLVMPIRIS